MHSLLAASASVDAESVSEGHTPLMRAARYGRLGCVRMLLGARAATALVDAQGWTATEHATRWGHEACAAVLRAHGDALEQMEAIQLTKPIGLEQMEATLVAHDPKSSRVPTEPSRFPTEPSCSLSPLRALSLFSFLVSPQNLLVSRLPVCVLASCGRRRSSDKRER